MIKTNFKSPRNKKLKSFALISLLLLLFIFPESVLAHSSEQPDISSTDDFEYWINDQEVKCVHYPYGTDMIQKSYRAQTVHSSPCDTNTTVVEGDSRIVCHGYHK